MSGSELGLLLGNPLGPAVGEELVALLDNDGVLLDGPGVGGNFGLLLANHWEQHMVTCLDS
jgi:hypothetical protein